MFSLLTASAGAGTYRDTVLATSGLVSYWRLGESAGPNAIDSVGPNTSPLAPSPVYGQTGALAADSNTAVLLSEATQDQISVSNHPSLNVQTYSWEFWVSWVNKGAPNQPHQLVHRDPSSASGSRQVWIGTQPGSTVVEINFNTTAGGYYSLLSTVTPVLNRWYHYVVTVQAGARVAIYIDGALNVQQNVAVTPVLTTSDLSIGTVDFGQGMVIKMDEVAFYNQALSAADVASHYNAGVAGRLVLTTPARTYTAGTCGGAAGGLTVQLQSGSGSAVSAPAGGDAFTLSSSSATGAFFTDSSCTTPAVGGAFSIPAGSNSVTAYYRDNTAGSPQVSIANALGLSTPAPQAQTVLSGTANRLVFTTQPSSAPAGATLNPVRVTVQDANGNTVSSAASIELSMDVNPGGSSLGGAAISSASNGVATFSDLSLDQPGVGYRFSAAATGLSSALSNTFDILTGPIPDAGSGAGGDGGTLPVPPTFDNPTTVAGNCGVPLHVSGDGPFVFSLETLDGSPVPEGLSIDSQTGVISWDRLGSTLVTQAWVKVRGPGGEARQLVDVSPTCVGMLALAVGCGCGAVGPSFSVFALAALFLLRGRRRRTTEFHQARYARTERVVLRQGARPLESGDRR